MATTVRVLVADNQPIFCAGLRATLAKTDDLQVVGEAYELQQLHSQPTEKPPDVILTAANLAADSLPEVAANWKQQFANSKLLIMLGQTHATNFNQVTAQAVDGCILKTEPTDSFIQAIRIVAQGDNYFSPAIWQTMIQPEAAVLPFTEPEKALLPFIITEMTVAEIALALYLSERTVTRHIETICQKFGVKKRLGAAVQSVRLGLA
jgi:DNA-binding NarL/FixJ family response regulator